MRPISLLASATFSREDTIWRLHGVICLESSDEGSNFWLETSPSDGTFMTSLTNNGELNLPSSLTFTGKIQPISSAKNNQITDLKLHLSLIEGLSRVEALMTSSILGDLSLFGSITELGTNWDLAIFGDIDETRNVSLLKRKNSWKSGLGMGKRLRVSGFHESPPEPTFLRYEYLNNQQVRIFWQVPIPIEGQVVCMRLVVKKVQANRKKQIWKNLEKDIKVEELPTDRLGKKEADGNIMCISFAPTALRSDETGEEESQYYAFYRNSTHSYVLGHLSTGEYECSISVQTIRNTLDSSSCLNGSNLVTETQFPPFYIHPPPISPSHLSVLVQKAKAEKISKSEPDIYEPFVVVSWKPPIASRKHFDKMKRQKEYQGGPADGFIVSIEVFNLHKDCWQPFGEPTITQISCLKSGLDKESCSLVALPETSEDCKGLYSKFRVLVSSFSKFGKSAPIYSNDLDIPRFSVDKITKDVDFSNLEETCCVICMENMCFEQRYNGLHDALYPALLCEEQNLPINGLVRLEEEMFNCPVTPTCCSHVFHLKCLLEWCKKSRERQTRELGRERAVPKCPLCMQEFKHVISQVLTPELQTKRQLFCSTAVLKKREFWTAENIHSRFAF